VVETPAADVPDTEAVADTEGEACPDLMVALRVALAEPGADRAVVVAVGRAATAGGASSEMPITRDPVTAYPADWIASHETPATPPTVANQAATAPRTARRATRPGRRPCRVVIVRDSQAEG
jgi:hypothetical protein